MKVRALFISDIHLGSRACQAAQLLEFLAAHDAEKIYLIGDIIDGLRLRARWYWPISHQTVVEHLVARARNGAEVYYVLGNHDAFLAKSGVLHGLGFEVCREHVHVGVDGGRYLVVHGDQFDVVGRRARWLSHLAGRAYEIVVVCNGYVNAVRRRLGLRYRPYAALIKARIKAVTRFIGEFETNLAEAAVRRGHRGVVCGHIHHATLRNESGCLYMNTGDWVESCSAIVEHVDGRFELLRWNGTQAESRRGSIRDMPVISRVAGDFYALLSGAMTGVLACLRFLVGSLRRVFSIL